MSSNHPSNESSKQYSKPRPISYPFSPSWAIRVREWWAIRRAIWLSSRSSGRARRLCLLRYKYGRGCTLVAGTAPWARARKLCVSRGHCHNATRSSCGVCADWSRCPSSGNLSYCGNGTSLGRSAVSRDRVDLEDGCAWRDRSNCYCRDGGRRI